MRCSPRRFHCLVVEAIEGIPERFRAKLRNIAVVVEEEATPEQRVACGIASDEDLYGYYEGTALTARAVDGEPILPDRIIVFRQPLLEDCEGEGELRVEIMATIQHEIAHHFGIEDDRLEELGKY